MIRLVNGSCTFRHGSTRIVCYVIRQTQDDLGRPRSVRLFPGNELQQHGRTTRQDASRGGDAGYWSTTEWEHKEGTLMILQLSTSMNGRPHKEASVLLRLRENAPLIQVSARTVTAQGNLLPTVNVFQGRADIMTPREFNLLGGKLTLQYIEKFCDTPDLEDVFRIRKLSEGFSDKPKLKRVRVRGEEKVVTESGRRKRKIRLRRRN